MMHGQKNIKNIYICMYVYMCVCVCVCVCVYVCVFYSPVEIRNSTHWNLTSCSPTGPVL